MLQSTRMQIPAMNSAESTRQVSDALVRIQGVADIGVDADQGVIEVRFDPEKTGMDAIRSAVAGAGFQVAER
jgi:copper chaperone CopZ